MFSKISLEQWRAFVATVECGGFLQAAEHLFKSQSAVSHSVNRMEVLLGHELFIIEGRKAVLTPLGQALLPQAKHLLGAAQKLEQLANQYQPGLFNELALAVDVLFPLELLQEALQGYSATFADYRIRLYETALSGAGELLEDGKVELGIASSLPAGYLQELLLTVKLVCVVGADHPLAASQGELGLADLQPHRQVVIRDSGTRHPQNSGWLGTSQRWTVSSLAAACTLVERGMGFAWLPEHAINESLAAGRLRRVALQHQRQREVPLYIGYPQALRHSPDVQLLVQVLGELCQRCNSRCAP
ncbi:MULTISPECIES: LysR family transcriptional regulator [Pseudomonas]|uniref:LysR family transcriptional regulator n=1 Tax=Pseudomonas TaxID=286 RepID=UPI00029AF9E3|nr:MULTISPECIES: LysR family transcriptional regulator [Pseudomonas]MBF4207637.1 LysR family transcriptional regulator [Pseudomonas donghuensis]MBS7600157.1 LysR family transcriptional regulator [Pseudomonas sp. RC2C2]MCP6695808.1 LysR family transcriptional regulator [Pseudomonas donghuensis]PJY93521.1 LysR family transcriptional regulator [Pseudomonas donghuensis]UVL25883.1 LysR family transcriptional regulator [Pseudomonas donghuensis]